MNESSESVKPRASPKRPYGVLVLRPAVPPKWWGPASATEVAARSSMCQSATVAESGAGALVAPDIGRGPVWAQAESASAPASGLQRTTREIDFIARLPSEPTPPGLASRPNDRRAPR